MQTSENTGEIAMLSCKAPGDVSPAKGMQLSRRRLVQIVYILFSGLNRLCQLHDFLACEFWLSEQTVLHALVVDDANKAVT